jgi:hypothetical protein
VARLCGIEVTDDADQRGHPRSTLEKADRSLR